MMRTTKSSKAIQDFFIHRTALAATTLKQLGEIHPTPYLTVITGVTLLILETVQSVRRNKAECAALIEQIYYTLDALIELYQNTAGNFAPALLSSVADFAETLQKLEAFMRTQQDMSRLKRFLLQPESTAQLEGCKADLTHSFNLFSTEVKGTAATYANEFSANVDQTHQELLELIADGSSIDQTSIRAGSAHSGYVATHYSSLSSFALFLPGAPHIFHGRDSELKDVVDGLLRDPARVAILGPGGIGKTALAKSALHHPNVVDKYACRYFVSCDSSETVQDLTFALGATLELDLAGISSKAIIQHLSSRPSSLVILDNFETPWERVETRSKVEDFLASLSAISHVALLITMRGQERPSNIRWTRPFLPVLKPLSDAAAYETFMDIADAEGDEDAPLISELLALAENLPLAVTLLGSIAALDGCDSVLERWKTESVTLLSDGYDKATNLETSLRLSLSSPRMASSPGALELLSLLSLLPDGISDVDLLNISTPISNLPRHKTTLLRTSLAYNDGGRLRVLAPLRELIRKLHPATYESIQAVRLHWATLLELWRTYEMPSGDLVQRLAGNAGNFNNLLQYTLSLEAFDLAEVVHDIFHLDLFASRTYGNSVPLMADIPAYLDRVDDNGLRGLYIWHLFDQMSAIEPSEAAQLAAQGSEYFRLARDPAGESRLHHVVAMYYVRLGDVNEASRHAELALSLADEADDNIRRTRALAEMARCHRLKGRFRDALELARRAQWCAGQVGNFFREIEALEEEAVALLSLGHFSQAAEICVRTRQLAIAAGLEGTQHEIVVLDYEASVYLHQTAYLKSRELSELMVKHSSADKFRLMHGVARVSVAAIDILLGGMESEDQVTAALAIPRQIFADCGYLRGLPMCDAVMADYLLISGRTAEALELYDKAIPSFRGESVELFCWCMHKLGDLSLRPHDVQSTTHWATTYFAYGNSTANRAAVAWGLRLLGEIFWMGGDDETSCSIFEVALEEFSSMVIYRGRAECLSRLGHLSQKAGEEIVAKDYFLEAQNMFLEAGMTADTCNLA
ncbi:AAA domain-containing protein [Favolaschia claudopus]|uniref:AAA domain-containing protein n=1 Tax=Favolaschia claudopus TaxID=2862362 RepID=A0AAW0AN10_9AGAR